MGFPSLLPEIALLPGGARASTSSDDGANAAVEKARRCFAAGEDDRRFCFAVATTTTASGERETRTIIIRRRISEDAFLIILIPHAHVVLVGPAPPPTCSTYAAHSDPRHDMGRRSFPSVSISHRISQAQSVRTTFAPLEPRSTVAQCRSPSPRWGRRTLWLLLASCRREYWRLATRSPIFRAGFVVVPIDRASEIPGAGERALSRSGVQGHHLSGVGEAPVAHAERGNPLRLSHQPWPTRWPAMA